MSTSQANQSYTQDRAKIGLLHPESPSTGGSGNSMQSSCMASRALKAYGTASKKSQNELVTEFIPLVHKIVSQVTSYLKPPLSRDDLVSAGCIGLIKAAKDYDPLKDADFKTYAYIRVRGAVIDELRSWSFVPSTTNKRIRELEVVSQQLFDELGTMPSDEQLSIAMGIELSELYKLYENSRGMNFLSIHSQNDDDASIGDSLAACDVSAPSANMQREELADALKEAIIELPENQRQLIVLYYQQELTMKEIAAVLEITESRVSQLHASAIYKLQIKLRQFDDSKQ